jgi:hypothetical protein
MDKDSFLIIATIFMDFLKGLTSSVFHNNINAYSGTSGMA